MTSERTLAGAFDPPGNSRTAAVFVAHIPKVRLRHGQMKLHTPYSESFLRSYIRHVLQERSVPFTHQESLSSRRFKSPANLIGNSYIDSSLTRRYAKIRTGGNLSDALDAIDGFTKKLTSAVRVGEETGSLDSMLNSIADSMEFESNMAIDKMVATLEPVLIVVMAIIVGFIMVSSTEPIYGSYDAISNSGILMQDIDIGCRFRPAGKRRIPGRKMPGRRISEKRV